jgi:hypothetical protein
MLNKMRKQLLISLLLYTTLTTSTINAASSANEFFQIVKQATISQLFNDSAPNVKDEIYRRVTNSKTAEGLGVNVMLFAPLRENADILKYSPSTSTNTTTAVGTLSNEQRDIKSNATGAETGAHKVTRAIGAVDSSPFTQAENAARLEAARKAEEQKLLHEHQSTKDAITAPEANERDNLKKAFSQSALQVNELHERIANSNEEQSARSALVDAHTQSLAEAKKAEAQRKQTELFNAQLADLQNAETDKRTEMENAEQHAKLQDAYTQSLAEAKNAEAKRKQTEALNAKLANLENAETDKRTEMENAEQHAKLQDAHTQSLAEAKKAEAQRKQTELFNAQLADLQNAESTDRAAIADDASLEKFKSTYDQSLEETKNAETQREFDAQLANLQNAESTDRTAIADDASLEKFKSTYDQSLEETKNAETQREFDAQLANLQNAESTDRAAIANNALIENSERNELSRRFQTEKSRLEEEQRKKASEAIAAALAEARLSMETQLENHLLELNKIREDLFKKLQVEQSEALKAKLQQKEQELTELTKQVNEIQQETLIAHDTAKVFGTYVADTIIETFARSTSQSTEAQQFKSIIDTQNFEQIISKIKEFLQKGMIQNNSTVNEFLERALTIHGARLDRIDNIKIKIANLKQ